MFWKRGVGGGYWDFPIPGTNALACGASFCFCGKSKMKKVKNSETKWKINENAEGRGDQVVYVPKMQM